MEVMKRMRMMAKRQVRHAATAHTPNVAEPVTLPLDLCALVLVPATQLQFTYSCTKQPQAKYHHQSICKMGAEPVHDIRGCLAL